MRERETSQVTDALTNRIGANQKFGASDLTGWMLRQLDLKRGERLLDVGCGTGKHLIEFAKAIGEPLACAGLDLSASSIDSARRAAEREGVSVSLAVQSMDDLDAYAEGRTFDTITSIYALYYSSDARRVLAAMKRMLPSGGGGRIAIAGPYSNNNDEWFKFIGRFMTLPESVIRSSTTFMYDHVLRFAQDNFGTIVCKRFVNEVCVPSKEELQKYWRSNIYYKEEHDPAFDALAGEYFATHDAFRYKKVAQLTLMSDPFDL